MPKTTETRTTKDDNPTEIHNVRDRRSWIIPTLLGLIAIFLLGLLAQGAHREGRFGDDMVGKGFQTMRAPRNGGMMGGSRYNTGQSSIRGVVTAVNGSTFTVAGNGATNDVETTSSTQYRNGSQVKVNDSVVAFGSTNSGKFTATQVVINP